MEITLNLFERNLFINTYNFFYINDLVNSQSEFSENICKRERNYASAIISRPNSRPSLAVFSALRASLLAAADHLALSRLRNAKQLSRDARDLAEECHRALISERHYSPRQRYARPSEAFASAALIS